MTSAALTLIVALLHMILDPPWKKRSPRNIIDFYIAWLLSDVLRLDRLIFWIWNHLLFPLRFLVSWISWSIFSSHKEKKALRQHTSRQQWANVLQKVLLTLSDQQLITGLAMIIAIIALHSTISVYHFTIISDLVWFSMTVHTQSMISLMYYLREAPVARNWRAILTHTIPVFLILAQIRTARFDWANSWPYDFYCVLNDLPGQTGDDLAYWVPVNITWILYRYVLMIFHLFEGAQELATKYLFRRPWATITDCWRRARQSSGFTKLLLFLVSLVLTAILGSLVLLTIVSDSACLLLALNYAWFGWGSYWIVMDRHNDTDLFIQDEAEMGFGQIVALVLLSTTVFTFGEAFHGNYSCSPTFLDTKDLQANSN